MTKQTKIVTGLLAGAALGAVVAMVITSDKSDNLKGKVDEWLCNLLDFSKEKLGLIGTMAKEKLTKVKA